MCLWLMKITSDFSMCIVDIYPRMDNHMLSYINRFVKKKITLDIYKKKVYTVIDNGISTSIKSNSNP